MLHCREVGTELSSLEQPKHLLQGYAVLAYLIHDL
jgi:hypothetical protein